MTQAVNGSSRVGVSGLPPSPQPTRKPDRFRSSAPRRYRAGVALSLLLVGARSQLGTALRRQADPSMFTVRALTSDDLDLRDRTAAQAAVVSWAASTPRAPGDRLAVVNTAAYTAVDDAEADPATARAVNADGPAGLAAGCARVGARLVQLSTDYVFSGDADRPYEVDDPTGPRSVYGRTKLAGEQAVRETLPEDAFVVRTAWLYAARGRNFVRTMVALERQRPTVEVVSDQRGSPTWADDLAAGLLALTRSAAPAGIYHVTNAGETSWYGLARAVFEELGADPSRVVATSADRFGRPAARPSYGVLSPRAWQGAGLPALPGWREALAGAFRTYGDAFRS